MVDNIQQKDEDNTKRRGLQWENKRKRSKKLGRGERRERSTTRGTSMLVKKWKD
jgi:hypothetical protein